MYTPMVHTPEKTKQQHINIWPGERCLLPVGEAPNLYKVECTSGEGYLRIMSDTHREPLRSGDHLIIDGGEIATITGRQTMTIEIKEITEEEYL